MNIHRFVILGFLTISICLYISLDSSASYDRIQIVITSSSDWTILTLNGNERIANAKSIPLQGSPECHWNQNSLSVNQPLEDALQGQSVQAQFNIILSSESPSSLSFESTKGSLGNVRIDFYNHNNNTPQMVDSVENTNTSGHPNPKLFSIDAEALLEGDFAYARPGIQPLILAFYYPWYKLDAWQSPYLQDKPLIPYSSDNMSTIYHHVCLAKQSGIDGFISSWWGPGSDTDQNLQKLLTVSENMDFKVSIYFETLTDSGPRTEAEILSWLRYFLQTYGEDLRFFQSSGKPVIFIWAAGTVPVNVWGNIFNTLESEGLDAIFIADTLNQDYLQVFDGLHTYGPTGTDPAYLETSEEIRTYGWLENNPQLKLWAATTQPGYDDRSLPGRVGLLIDRAGGATYINTFNASIETEPDWILITTFNEWWENTHIEPSQNYGDLYLEITGEYADIYKGFILRPPSGFYVSPISEPDGSNKLIYNRPFAQNPDSYNIYRHTQPFSDISKPPPLATGIKQLSYVDLPLSDGKYYYAVTAVLGSTESPLSEVRSAISSRNKSKADPSKEIPVDVAIYAESTCWIQIPEAEDLANAIIQNIGNKVNDVRIVSSGEFPEWILSHTKNGQPDIIILFGDFPDSIYPSGNEEPDNSLAELFLDDGNIFLNTADYIFYGMDRNNTEGLVNMIDVQTTMWGDNTHVTVTDAGRKFIPFLQDFTTDRPLHIAEFAGTDWEVEVSFADNGTNLADPAIIRNKKTGGRVGIIFQTLQTLSYVSSARAEVISEIVLNWLPTALSNIILYSGWNMVSFPGTLSNPSVDAIIPQGSNIIPPLYTYDPASFSYKEVTEVKPGEGYWILSLADEYLRADMIAPMTGITLDLKLGWNMIGGVNGTVDFTIPQDDPDNSVIPPIYTYNPTSFGYEERTSIQPGIGYWVLALQECSLTLNSNAAPPRNKAVRTYTAEPDWIVPIQAVTGKSIKEIVLGVQSNASDSFDPYIDKAMPPKASMVSTQPEISFLVKDQLVTYLSRDIRKNETDTLWNMEVESKEGAELKWDISSLPVDRDMSLQFAGTDINMRNQKDIRIPSGRHIVIITLKDRIPSNPELLQNYPNPFNPETWIPYQLSEAGKVVISIYDVNGHLVRKLDLGNKEAGIYATKEKAVYWDGRNESGERVSSGVYFYQIQSDKFSKVMKLVVIK